MKSISQWEKKKNINVLTPIFYAAGAALAITASNPLGVIRFRLQTMPELLRQGSIAKPYSGLIDCAKRIFKQQKIFGFWKGNMSVLLRFYPAQLFNFFLKQSFSKILLTNSYFKGINKFVFNSLNGISSGFITITILYPLDYARLKLTNNIQGKKKSIYQSIASTFRVQGMRGIYRGILFAYIGMVLFRGSFFGFYDTFKSHARSNIQKFLISYSATVFSLFLTSPLQTITRRMMMTSGHSFKYNGYADCFKQILNKQGLKGFYRGGSVIPFQSITIGFMFTLFDKVFRQLRSIEDYSL